MQRAIQCNRCQSVMYITERTWEAGELGSKDIRIDTTYRTNPDSPYRIYLCVGCGLALVLEQWKEIAM